MRQAEHPTDMLLESFPDEMTLVAPDDLDVDTHPTLRRVSVDEDVFEM